MSRRAPIGCLLCFALTAACGDDDGAATSPPVPPQPPDAAAPLDGSAAQDAAADDAADVADTTPPADGGSLPDATPPPDADASSGSRPPNEDGAFVVARDGGTLPDATAVAFVPGLAGGTRAPLVVLKHGFQLATSSYAVLAERIASHGFVVVGVDTAGGLLGGPTNADERDATVSVISWALADAPFAASVDGSRIAVVGHSRGGKVATWVAASDARVSAALLLDPVNGCGPGAGFTADCPDATSPAIAGALAVPVGVMGETQNGSGGFMPCAPLDQNYQTFYAAASAAPWAVEWTFTGADHMDFTDDGGGLVGSFCPDGPDDDARVRAGIRTLAVAFLRRHLSGEVEMDAWLTGASLPPGVTTRGP
ncbi:MAG: alpha/beta hydrolase fold domain-containing protein [Deltaproteobacteria bacterium]|nr:alpha/beta hydrolase fold domain-containing protein [Deltaproteobacteria bacterium]